MMTTPAESSKRPLDDIVSVAKLGRRRLLKVGISATPVILTLASRSVLACHCKSPSAAGSVTNASHRPQDDGGFSINVKTFTGWMAFAYSGGTLPGGVTRATLLKDIPLFSTVFAGDMTKIKFATGFRQKIVTAYLNLHNDSISRSSCLTLLQLQKMASGSYSDPTNNVTYTRSDIETYLQQNYLLG